MYRYDEFDAQIVKERVDQFRGQVERRLSGEILEDEFKPLRLAERRLSCSCTPTCCAWPSRMAS